MGERFILDTHRSTVVQLLDALVQLADGGALGLERLGWLAKHGGAVVFEPDRDATGPMWSARLAEELVDALDHEGRTEVPGLGTFERVGEGVEFEASKVLTQRLRP